MARKSGQTPLDRANHWGALMVPTDNHAVKKHIYIYSPSGAVRDKAAFKRGVKRLQKLGHEVEVERNIKKTEKNEGEKREKKEVK